MHLYKKENGKCWYVKFNYHDENGQYCVKTISTGISKRDGKKIANKRAVEIIEDFLKEVENRKLVVNHSDNARCTHKYDTFSEYSEYWLTVKKNTVKNNTLIDYKRQLDKHIIPRIGMIRIMELNQYDLIEFINKQLATCDALQEEIDKKEIEAARTGKPIKIQTGERPFYSSIRKHFSLIKEILDYAYCEGDVEFNAAERVNKEILKKMPKRRYKVVPYTAEEIQTLINAIKGTTIEAPVMLASCLGLRRSEILGLKWESIDFDNDLVRIKDTCVLEGTKIVYRDDSTKNESSNSVLPLPANLKEYLLNLRNNQLNEKEFLGRGYIDSGLVCTYADGSGIKPGYVSEVFHKILLENNLRLIRFHDLRHTVGTLIYQQTGDIKMTSEILRHSNIKTTADIYVDPDMNYKRKGLDIVNILKLT